MENETLMHNWVVSFFPFTKKPKRLFTILIHFFSYVYPILSCFTISEFSVNKISLIFSYSSISHFLVLSYYCTLIGIILSKCHVHPYTSRLLLDKDATLRLEHTPSNPLANINLELFKRKDKTSETVRNQFHLIIQ